MSSIVETIISIMNNSKGIVIYSVYKTCIKVINSDAFTINCIFYIFTDDSFDN